GGINEKIEGFFDLCAARGLSGEQGVLIPAANVAHLMLKPAVVQAARQGLFRIWPVATVDEALALLTGLAPEALDARIQAGLQRLAQLRRAFGRGDGGEAES
ncbi:MAG: ATP-dependent protease, partial [Hylemonella sp.]